MKESTRQELLGIMFADGIIEAAHQTYKASRGKAIIKACIKRLQERSGEIQPKKADPNYKEARYGKKGNKPRNTGKKTARTRLSK